MCTYQCWTRIFIPFIKALNADGLTDLKYQQDNASPHTARRTKEWLKEIAETNGLTLMEWPSNSPDINPIEHLWAYLKFELHRLYKNTATLKGSPATIRAAMRLQLHDLWWKILEEVLNHRVNNMPHRVQALLEAKGWYTRY